MKKYILFGLTIFLTTLIPIQVVAQAEEWDAQKIAQMVGAMSWCTNNAAKNTSEASVYQSARRAGTMALQKAITNGEIETNTGLNILKQVETEGKYSDKKLDQELCQEIWQSVNESSIFKN
ncbi:MAG: hypothetical protein QNJ68_05115 [Microcoleaceae cyanobacterium MO_207.B10]|nr:hypothetical protein [Microcoleaceae cyanobacterium MO_207.B10]